MKNILSLLMCMTMAACTQLPVAMPGGVVAHATMVGGKGSLSYDKYGRPIYIYNNENSLQHFFQFGAAVVGGVAGAVTQKSSDALAATKDTNAAGVTKNAADNATKQNADNLAAASKDLATTTHASNAVQLSTILKKGPPKSN